MLLQPLGHPHNLGVLEHSRNKEGCHTKEPTVSQRSQSREADAALCYPGRGFAPSGAGQRELEIAQTAVKVALG